MACGKGSGKTMIGNQLTKDNIDNLSKSWLVQKQTAFGKDESNPLTACGLLKITWLSNGPRSHTLKYLATPEVMAFGKEIISIKLHKILLGTSNSLVWGIDECLNTHHSILI